MKIDIFDVGHGACSVITAPNGKRIMIDCGHRKTEPYWWPSIHFFGQSIDVLILTNFDEDHVSDFRDMRKNVGIRSIWGNNSIDALCLYSMKPAGMQDGVRSVQEYLQQPTALNLAVDLSPMKISLFRNSYGEFTDTNNLSLVTFVEYGQFCAIFPGDLQEKGWTTLLSNTDFQAYLRRVNLFMAAHHGREDGYCAEVFERFCRPDAFIISDKEMIHDTQETTAWYRQHAKGLVKILKTWHDTPDTRYVFTTRNDSCMSIDVELTGNFILQLNSDCQTRKNVLDLSGLAGILSGSRS